MPTKKRKSKSKTVRVTLTAAEKRQIDAMGKDWMVRTSNDGVAYNGFKSPPVGEWMRAPDWNPEPVCGGGFHGQGPHGAGYWHEGTRFEFCEIEGGIVCVEGNKTKAERYRIVWTGAKAYAALAYACKGKWNGSLAILVDCELALTECGHVYVREGATFQAPALTEVGGSVYVREGATFQAPALTECGHVYVVEGATFQAPALTKCGSVYVLEGATFQAPALTKCGSVYVRPKGKLIAPKLKR